MIRLRHTILTKVPDGAVPVTEPYREGAEDWMLTRTINQLQATGTPIVLVEERASKERGSFVGVAVYRLTPYQRSAAPQPEKRKATK